MLVLAFVEDVWIEAIRKHFPLKQIENFWQHRIGWLLFSALTRRKTIWTSRFLGLQMKELGSLKWSKKNFWAQQTHQTSQKLRACIMISCKSTQKNTQTKNTDILLPHFSSPLQAAVGGHKGCSTGNKAEHKRHLHRKGMDGRIYPGIWNGKFGLLFPGYDIIIRVSKYRYAHSIILYTLGPSLYFIQQLKTFIVFPDKSSIL